MKKIILLSCLSLSILGCVSPDSSEEEINLVIVETSPDKEGDKEKLTENENQEDDEIEGIVEEIRVIETFPAMSSNNIEPSSTIQIQFNTSMDSKTMNASNLRLTTLENDEVEIDIEYDAATRIASIIPKKNLNLITTYSVNIGDEIRSEKGAVMTPYTWNFTVRDGKWSAPEVIQADLSQEGFITRTVVNDGIPTVLWGQYSNFRGTLWTTNYIPDLGWQYAEQFEWHFSEFSAHSATIVKDGLGNMAALWVLDNGGKRLAYRFYTKGKGWGEPGLTKNLTDVWNPTAAFDTKGRLLVVWGSRFGGIRGFYSDGEFTDLGKISSPGSEFADRPQIKFDKNGDAIICWSENDGIWASRFTKASRRTQLPGRLSTSRANDFPKLISGDEGVSVIWSQREGIYSQQFTTRWEQAQKLTSQPTSYFKAQRSEDGNILLVWWSDGIKAKLFDAQTGTWGEEVFVDADSDVRWPELALDKKGNAIVTWHRRNGRSDTAWFARYVAENNRWTAPEKLVREGLSKGVPTVGFLDDGTAVASFGLFNGNRTSIVGLRFD